MSSPLHKGGPEGPPLRDPEGPPLRDPALRDPARIGVIGAGRIGAAIIGHLVRHGFTVGAYDADASKQAAVEERGATWSPLTELARWSDAVLVIVGYDSELRALVADGLLDVMRRETILAVLSTVQPETVQQIAAQGASVGIRVVDATMCRGGRAADAGTMLSFVAGEPDAIEALNPVIAAYSNDIIYTGAAGTAQAAKAANNLLMWACLIANHEALALAQRFGVDIGLLREALLKTGAENGVLRNWGTSTMAWADDDLEIIQEMARQAHIALPQADLNRRLCRELKPRKFRLDEYGRT